MSVDRCVCHNVTFAALRTLAREVDEPSGSDRADADIIEHVFAELQRMTGCSTGCGMCRPYVMAMLRTGRTRFAVMEDLDT